MFSALYYQHYIFSVIFSAFAGGALHCIVFSAFAGHCLGFSSLASVAFLAFYSQPGCGLRGVVL